jgi:elongation factor P--(R)-beta-lysine ligase
MASPIRQQLALRAGYLDRARAYFASHGVLEVETPLLSNYAVTDPHVECLTAGTRQFLRPSPEYALKRLLSKGSGDIYEIGKVFRQGECSSRHNPEFTLVEWYRLGFDLQAIINDTVDFIRAVAADSRYPITQVKQLKYAELFAHYAGIDPLAESSETLSRYAVAKLGEQLSKDLPGALGRDRQAWLDLIMTHIIEPALQQSEPDTLIAVTHYPAAQALLAKLSDKHPGTAERFEIYYRGNELANGFFELQDPVEQRRRFMLDRQQRAAVGLPVHAIDEALLTALSDGLPECSGVAIGLDRLIMSCEGYSRIADTLALSEQNNQQ